MSETSRAGDCDDPDGIPVREANSRTSFIVNGETVSVDHASLIEAMKTITKKKVDARLASDRKKGVILSEGETRLQMAAEIASQSS